MGIGVQKAGKWRWVTANCRDGRRCAALEDSVLYLPCGSAHPLDSRSLDAYVSFRCQTCEGTVCKDPCPSQRWCDVVQASLFLLVRRPQRPQGTC